ncbi:MAG: glycosyl hydrolase family 79 C-terminal domain-containing protein [Terriglobia bacterium]
MAWKCSQSATVNTMGQTPSVRLNVDPEQVFGVIPPDFVGLGYEISSVARVGLLSGRNRAYVQLVRALGTQGTIRVGGNTLDYSTFSPQGRAVSAPEPQATLVNASVIEDLGEFLDATGWKLIWGLNLGRGTPQQAVEEAQAVAASANGKLLALEVGNEPDLFDQAHRPQGYGYEQFLEEYRRYRDAVRAKLPDVPFAGPDVAVKTDWVTRFAADEGRDIKLLTHHYYAEGPPKNPASTIENLLRGDEKLTRILAQCRSASRLANLPYRICETNSCFGGGKPGVSDTFASALWGLDFLFTLAAADASGVNLETGVNQHGFVSSYSPIGDDEHGNYSAKPLYYGVLAFAQASRGRRVKVQYDAGNLNVKAYAVLGEDKRLSVTLINKEASQGVEVSIVGTRAFAGGSLLRLAAPSLESKGEVTLGGAAVAADGQWAANRREQLATPRGKCVIEVPAASAAFVTLVG